MSAATLPLPKAIASHAFATPSVEAFFDAATNTISYVVYDAAAKVGLVVDSVFGFDNSSGRTNTESADQICAFAMKERLAITLILETHVHADHLSAAPYIQDKLGGAIAIGSQIAAVQEVFGKVFNAGEDFRRDGSQFDVLFDDGDQFAVGGFGGVAIHTPGHTPACVSYLIGDALFVGDTMFMPDFGTARCDFPGGDAATLFRSIKRLFQLPAETRVFLCHDYKSKTRDYYAWDTTIGDERRNNIHVRDGVSKDAYVKMRSERDETLATPALMLPSVQVNMNAGRLPAQENNGRRYLKLPLDAF